MRLHSRDYTSEFVEIAYHSQYSPPLPVFTLAIFISPPPLHCFGLLAFIGFHISVFNRFSFVTILIITGGLAIAPLYFLLFSLLFS